MTAKKPYYLKNAPPDRRHVHLTGGVDGKPTIQTVCHSEVCWAIGAWKGNR